MTYWKLSFPATTRYLSSRLTAQKKGHLLKMREICVWGWLILAGREETVLIVDGDSEAEVRSKYSEGRGLRIGTSIATGRFSERCYLLRWFLQKYARLCYWRQSIKLEKDPWSSLTATSAFVWTFTKQWADVSRKQYNLIQNSFR